MTLKPQRKACKPRVPDAHTYSPEARIAKRFRYCRNYAHETQKRPGMDAGARRTAPRTARFDGFVRHRSPSSIISYSILAAQRSTWGSCVCRSGSWGLHHYIKQDKNHHMYFEKITKKSYHFVQNHIFNRKIHIKIIENIVLCH